MKDPSFIENILRVNPDVIYASNLTRAQQTAQEIQHILLTYRHKTVEIITDENLSETGNIKAFYQDLLAQKSSKSMLLVSHQPQGNELWQAYYSEHEKLHLKNIEIIKLPTYPIVNELDKWILAALNESAIEVENAMNTYQLDNGTKAILGFLDKLNNWYIRRSRRRFWASGMDDDKVAAYTTLYEVLE